MRPVQRPNPALDHWFATEILPSEAALNRYIRRVWSNPADVAELRQEIYVRVYQSALQARPELPKSFLFATARNLLSDRIRRGRVISIDYTQDLDALIVLIDEVSPERRLTARQQLNHLMQCLDRLPSRSRDAIWLRRIEGLSQREAAQRLGILEKTLAGYLSRGLDTLARYVLSDEAPEPSTDGASVKSRTPAAMEHDERTAD